MIGREFTALPFSCIMGKTLSTGMMMKKDNSSRTRPLRLVLAALFWKRTNLWGALAGMVSGGVVVFVWKYVIRPLGGAWDIYELLPAFIVSCIAIVAVSLLTAKPDEEIERTFDEVAAEMKAK